MAKKIINLMFLISIAVLSTGCLSSMLSIGEEQSMCDKNTKRLGKCAGITEVMNNRYQYANDYIKGYKNED